MMINKDWLPHGTHWGLHVEYKTVTTGPMGGGGHKLLWHTTEGSGIDGGDSTVRANGDEPHFMIDTHSGRVIQYVALDQFSRSLRHPAGTLPTNGANTIQVEIVGFSRDSGKWSTAQYKKLAALACLIEHRVRIPRKSPGFSSGANRMGERQFYDYAGHCGHMHAPGNDHTDPGNGFSASRLFRLMETLTEEHR